MTTTTAPAPTTAASAHATTAPASTTAVPVTAVTGTEDERAGAIATLVAAFAADPVIRWFFPHSDRFLTHFPQVLHLLGGVAFDAGTADRAEGDAAVALWVPPDVEPDDDAVAELMERTIDPHRQDATWTFLAKIGEHHPTITHWYLPFIGTDPCWQGRGLGSAVLATGLARCDRDGLPAYLEASSADNRRLYERHGFEVVGEIQVADSPPLWPMWRDAD
jgi:ribosomal protein S18 acetylase RimI-like enzyme